MTTLDRATLEYLIENLTNYDHEYDRGAQYQTMYFRKGDQDIDIKYFLADDLRKWFVELIHDGYLKFLPEGAEKEHKLEAIKGLEVGCVCGWSEKIDIAHPYVGMDEDERELKSKFYQHVEDEVKKMEERFQWE